MLLALALALAFSYSSDSAFTVVPHWNALPSGPEKASKSVADCEATCVPPECNQWTYNLNSGHCRVSASTKWIGAALDHTTSGCIPDVVSGCPHSPPPPSPSPPSPAYDGVLRSDPDGSTVAYMIPPYKSNHASTIEVLGDGVSLVAAWFSGEKEEAAGCAIVFARLLPNATGWSTAATLSKRAQYSNQNPVLFYDTPSQVLYLYHSQAPAESGESSATIVMLNSTDNGVTWSKPAQWLTTPGAFPRNRIIPTLTEGVLFPYYNAGKADPTFKENYSLMGRCEDASKDLASAAVGWKFTPVPKSGDLVQPSVVRLQPSQPKLLGLFRDRRAKNIYSATSMDDGLTWSEPKASVLPNNNAGIEANILGTGEVVLAYNPQTSGRDPLGFAMSSDGGATWPHKRLLQHGDSSSGVATNSGSGNEFSYPTVMQTKDGMIHVMYTYNRETIKYKRFARSWIAGK